MRSALGRGPRHQVNVAAVNQGVTGIGGVGAGGVINYAHPTGQQYQPHSQQPGQPHLHQQPQHQQYDTSQPQAPIYDDVLFDDWPVSDTAAAGATVYQQQPVPNHGLAAAAQPSVPVSGKPPLPPFLKKAQQQRQAQARRAQNKPPIATKPLVKTKVA